MESYDRLFPSQDTLVKGGFGNLIALPLQHESRQKRNTVFLDENFTPYEDQWAYLASIKKLQRDAVQRIASEAVRQDSVIGVSRDSDEDGNDQAPWNRTPSRKKPKKKVTGKFPSITHGVFAQRLFVEKKDLPSSFITRIKRLAAFQNPMFYEKQSLRLSTARIPRVITCFEDHPAHIAIPRGSIDSLQDLFVDHGVKLVLDDKRIAPAGSSYSFHGTLRETQQAAIDKLLQHDLGILSAPPGFGKTVIGAHLIAKRGCNTLVLVHRKELLEQWVARLSLFLGIDPKEIGKIGAGKNKPNGMPDVSMIQSLVRKDEVNDIVAGYGQDRQRWSRYIIDSLIETTLSRDILLLTGRQTRAVQTAFPARMLAFEQDTLLSKDDRPAPGRRQHDDPGPLSGTARRRRHADRPAQVLRAEGTRAGLEPQVTGIEHGTHQRAKTGRPEARSWNRPTALI